MSTEQQMLEELRRISESIGGLSRQGGSSQGKPGGSRGGESLEDIARDLARFRNGVKESGADLGKWQDKLADSADKLDRLKDEVERTGKGADKLARAQTEYNRQITDFTKARSFEKFGQEAAGAARTMGDAAAKSARDLVTGFSTGSMGIGIATGTLTAAADGMGAGMRMAGAGLEALGTASIVGGPIVRALGLAAGATGTALTQLGTVLPKVARTMLEVIGPEVEKQIAAYHKLSSAGAAFSGGLTALKEAAVQAKLDLSQFAEVISRNQAMFAQTGFSTNAFVRAMGRSAKAMGETGIGKQILNLGYSVEERAQLEAEVIAGMARFKDSMPQGNEIAQATLEYAKNLRVIAQFTGEDAKAKIAQAKAENDKLKMNTELAKMGIDVNQVAGAFAVLPDVMKNMLRNMIITQGDLAVNDSRTGLAASLSETSLATVKEMYALLRQGKLDSAAATEIWGRNGGKIKSEVESADVISQASMLGGKLQEFATDLNDIYNHVLKTSSVKGAESITAEAAASQTALSNTSDKFTSTVTSMQQSLQDVRMAIQEHILTPRVMEKYAEAASAATRIISDVLNELGAVDKPAEPVTTPGGKPLAPKASANSVISDIRVPTSAAEHVEPRPEIRGMEQKMWDAKYSTLFNADGSPKKKPLYKDPNQLAREKRAKLETSKAEEVQRALPKPSRPVVINTNVNDMADEVESIVKLKPEAARVPGISSDITTMARMVTAMEEQAAISKAQLEVLNKVADKTAETARSNRDMQLQLR